MAITLTELESLLDEIGYRYEQNDKDDLIILFNAENYVNFRGDKTFVIVIQLSEEGEYIKFFHPMAYQLTNPKTKGAALEVFASLAWRVKMVDFEFDPSDGEVRPTLDYPIEDADITPRQLQRSVTIIPRILDQFHSILEEVIETGEFKPEMLDVEVYNELTDDISNNDDEHSQSEDKLGDEESEVDLDELREQLQALIELLDNIDDSDDEEDSIQIADDSSINTDESPDSKDSPSKTAPNKPNADPDDDSDDFEFI